MVNNLQHAFEKATKKYFDQNSSDEDGDLEYPDLKTNVFREKSNSAKNTITPKIKEIIGSKGLPLKSKKADNVEKSEQIDEKPIEKRGRKRKQKFKDKRKAGEKVGTTFSDDDELVEDDDNDDDDLDEKDVVPAKRAKKEQIKDSKKSKKIIDKKSIKDSNAAITRRKSGRKDPEPIDDESDVETEPVVTKKKKAKHVSESTAASAATTTTTKATTSTSTKTTPEKGPEKGKSKTGGHAGSKKELKKSKSNKKRKSSEVEMPMDISDANDTEKELDDNEDEEIVTEKESPRKGRAAKKTEKKVTRKSTQMKSKQSEKKVGNKKKTGKGKQQKNAARDESPSRSRSASVSSNASSMSNSPIRFTVDLHEKYSKSASNTSINKIDNVESSKHKSHRAKVARSPSPSLSLYSSENSNSVKDKFDLIKERRNRANNGKASNSDDKWKQIVKNAEKIKDKTTTADGSKVQEKNQKLKETIEKLKQKNKQSKKLLTKLSDAKSSSNVSKTEEKSPFDLLRESKPPKAKAKSKEFAVSGGDLETSTTSDGSNKKSPNKKPKEKVGKGHKKGKHTNKTANMEALELETEQTLKDINRWLEHTPRFPEFNSASNSPTRFNSLLYDFDTVTKNLDPADFRRPMPITNDSTSSATTTFTSATTDHHQKSSNATTSSTSASTNTITTTAKTTSAKHSSIDDCILTAKENKPAPKQTIQLTGIPPPPPGPHKRDKEPKRKTLKDKFSAMIPKRKDIHRTIERMQPGKTKGNLIGNIHSAANKQEDISILGTSNLNKLKDAKNSLVQETDDTGPKLSLGTVLNTAGFGLIQQHNFADNENTKGKDFLKIFFIFLIILNVNNSKSSFKFVDEDLLCDSVSKDACSDDMELEEIVTTTEQMARDKERKEKEEKEKAEKQSPGDKSATPNLNAWLKAFGVPKKAKKSEEDDAKKPDKIFKESSQNSNSQSANSPTISNEQSTLPATRTRKASTGSTISERSSYSQDPDSPRIGIDERICGSYPAPYPSPLGASPIMTSPKDDTPTQTKPTSPYASMNGSIRVGFYQDTTTKSSPEKSCSPREQPSASPYSNYAQHLYVSTTTSGSSNSYGNMSYTSPVKVNQTQNQNQAPLGFNKKQPSYFDQYKQPKSQDSDYNSSVGSNPASPYQSQHSPYQSENSPYQQSQTSPYAQQPNSIQSNVSSPYQNQQSPYQDSSMQQQHSPYNQNNAGQDVHTQHIASMPKTSPQPIQSVSPHISPSMNTVSASQQHQQQSPSTAQQPLENKTVPSSMQYGLQAYSSHYPNLVDPPAPSVINSSSSLHDKSKPNDDEQRDILNLDYAKPTSAANKSSHSNKPTDLSHIDPLSKPPQQHGYEHSMFEPMAFNKSYDISSTKAIEMFNRAATMSFSKSFPTPLSAGGSKNETTAPSSLLNTYQPPSMHSNYSLYSLDNKSATHIGYPTHESDAQSNQSQSMHHPDKHLDPTASVVRHGLYGADRMDAMSSSMPTASMPNDNRMKPSELNVPTIPHRYDVPTYDPNMRIHSLVDDNLNGSNCYYPPKDPSVAQSLYGKNVLPPPTSSQPPSSTLNHPYKLPPVAAPPTPQPVETKPKRTRKKKNAEPAAAQPPPPTPTSVQTSSILPPHTQAPSVINNHQMMQQHNLGWNTLDSSSSHTQGPNQISQQQPQPHASILNQQHPQHPLQAPSAQGLFYNFTTQNSIFSLIQIISTYSPLGFQSYAGLKPSSQTGLVKNTPPPEATPISLKTNSIVPGSAFNFGPTSSGSLALGGIYGENTPYLDEYRASANPYYLPPQTHRTSAQPEQNPDNTGVPTAAGSPA